MLVLFAIIQAVLAGAHLATVLGGLSLFQLASLAHAGISAPRDISRIVALSRALDRRFPCDAKCHRTIAARQLEVRGGPLGYGRSPLQF